MDWHHSFEIRIGLSKIGKDIIQTKANSMIGKYVQIGFGLATAEDIDKQKTSFPDYFVGVITSVDYAFEEDRSFQLVYRGQSPTILMDEGPHTRSFTGLLLPQIVDKVTEDYKKKINPFVEKDIVNDPTEKVKTPYLVQYKESNFEFLFRIGARFGQWFFYDGLKLHFSKKPDLPKEQETELAFPEGLKNFNVSVKAVPVQFKLASYDYLTDDFPEISPTYSGQLGAYAAIAHGKSKEGMFKTAPFSPVVQGMNKEEVENLAEIRQNYQVNEMVVLSGISTWPDLKIGSEIRVLDKNLNGQPQEYGSYIVTEIDHDIAYSGNYVNRFEAIPSEVELPPLSPNVKPPYCETQLAVVVANDDKEGDGKSLGRVKVQFAWQRGTNPKETSPWIRVSTPYPGAKKGFYITPETGDQVLVDFEHHNPDKPYVVGGFYHGKAKPEYWDKDNNQKAFKTRSGNRIYFNDEKDKEQLTIASPEDKNIITLSLQKNDPKSLITIKTQGNISISAEKDITIDGKNITIKASEKLDVSAKEIAESAQKDFSMKGMDVKVNADKAASVQASGQVSIQSGADTSISAAMIKLNS